MGVNQIITGPVTGPIDSNGGAITVTKTGSIAGGPDGVDAVAFSITKLTNRGAINAAAGAASATGGLGVSNLQTIGALINTGSVFGAFSNVLPSGTYQPRGVPSFCRVENGKLLEPTNLQTVLTTATEVMRRRGCELSVPYAAMVHALYDSTAAQRTQAIQWSNRRQMRRSA